MYFTNSGFIILACISQCLSDFKLLLLGWFKISFCFAKTLSGQSNVAVKSLSCRMVVGKMSQTRGVDHILPFWQTYSRSNFLEANVW